VQDVILPLSNPVRGVNGEEIAEIPIAKDTEILISITSSNINPEIWGPDANDWKPERWLSALPDSVKNAHIPGVYSHL
jgi:cytochrome P450